MRDLDKKMDAGIRRMVSEKVKNILIGYVGSCTCIEGYTSRNLKDPTCVACTVGMDDGELVGELTELVMAERKMYYF